MTRTQTRRRRQRKRHHMTSKHRRDIVMQDSVLYDHWQSTELSLTDYVRSFRAYIDRVLEGRKS